MGLHSLQGHFGLSVCLVLNHNLSGWLSGRLYALPVPVTTHSPVTLGLGAVPALLSLMPVIALPWFPPHPVSATVNTSFMKPSLNYPNVSVPSLSCCIPTVSNRNKVIQCISIALLQRLISLRE